MEDKALTKMFLEKQEWTNKISDLITSDKRSGVWNISYAHFEKGQWRIEEVRIYYAEGYTDINVTGNSLGSILREIAREVYGDGAYGRITNEWW